MLISTFIFLASTLRCHKRVASVCKCKERTSTAGPSLNCHGERLRTLLTSRPLTYVLYLLIKFLHLLTLYAFQGYVTRACEVLNHILTFWYYHTYSNRLLTSGWWAFARKPVSTFSYPFLLTLANTVVNSPPELYCWLGSVVDLGPGCWLCLAYPLLLFRLLHLRPRASMRKRLRAVSFSFNFFLHSSQFSSTFHQPENSSNFSI